MNRRMFFEFRPYLLFLTTMSKALGAPSSDPQASADQRAFNLNLNRLQKRHHQSSRLFETDNETYASTASINKYRGLILIIRHFGTPQGHLRLSTLPHHHPLSVFVCCFLGFLSLLSTLTSELFLPSIQDPRRLRGCPLRQHGASQTPALLATAARSSDGWKMGCPYASKRLQWSTCLMV